MIRGHSNGYTIVEAMIFIAVSSALFIGAMTAIGGRQQQVQFTQAVRNFDSQLKDLMNDVSTGFFPATGGVSCTVARGAPSDTRPALSVSTVDETADQGTNDSCVFVGKALQFGPSSSGMTQNDRLLVHTLVGRRINAAEMDVNGIAEANPVVVAPDDAADLLPNFTTEIVFDWGMRVNRVVVPGASSNTQYGTIGLFNTFSSTQSADPISQSQTIDMGPITGTEIGNTVFEAIAELNRISDNAPIASEVGITLNPLSGVVLCLSDPDQSRQAAITLSSANRRLSSVVTFDQVDSAICG